ncbi:MAG: DUF1294 domain-containing protein [Lachnospiraceae bacterium]|nr:DUF1294 domain-containing protein [Lachnospiraceae bacterium]
MLENIGIAYAVIINIIGFTLMGVDKKRAIRGAYRISEASLFMVAILGGALGATLGMHHFRHKTRHWYFRLGLPFIFLVEIAILIYLNSPL